MDDIQKRNLIEAGHLSHFKALPQALGFCVEARSGVTYIPCHLGSSMFNIAFGAPDHGDLPGELARAKSLFKGQPFAWWVPPSLATDAVAQEFLAAGFHKEAPEHAMIRNLTDFEGLPKRSNLQVEQVTSKKQLDDFIDILSPYDETAQAFYGRLEDAHLSGAEHLFVGYANGACVTIGILHRGNTSAGLFSLVTKEEARGQGYGQDMMVALMGAAKAAGRSFITLSASSDAGFRLYGRLGFETHGAFGCFEFTGTA